MIEVKLHNNPESRRAVVAQVLAYAAAIHGLTATEFEQAVVKHLGDGRCMRSSAMPHRPRPPTPRSSARRGTAGRQHARRSRA